MTLQPLPAGGGLSTGGFCVDLSLRPSWRSPATGKAGAASFLDRRAGQPFSLHPGNPFGERLVAFTREEAHDLADMGEQIHGATPGRLAPPRAPGGFLFRTIRPCGSRLASQAAGRVFPMTAVGLVMHRGMQEGRPSGWLRLIPMFIILTCQIISQKPPAASPHMQRPRWLAGAPRPGNQQHPADSVPPLPAASQLSQARLSW